MKTSLRKVVAVSTLGMALTLSGIGISDVSAQGDKGPKNINITPAQEACLISAKANIAPGPNRKASVKEAAKKCGIWKRFAKLSTAQQTCLATYGLSRPAGRPSKAQKRQLKTLAAKCGITLTIKK
ncbi:MAG: hypothetical protein ACO3JF_06835 [Ilumatobacteraceae bacterium]